MGNISGKQVREVIRLYSSNNFDMGQVYMAIAFSIFPVIIVYLVLSRQIVQGVAVGSVKE